MSEEIKIAKRRVYDEIVESRLRGSSNPEDIELLNFVASAPAYKQPVKTAVAKVELARSESGLIYKGIDSSLKATLKQLELESKEDAPCALNFIKEGQIVRKFNIDLREVRILKAIAVEQINYCSEYANVLGQVFQIVCKSVIDGTHVRAWRVAEGFTDIQEVIFEGICKFVDSYLEKGEQL